MAIARAHALPVIEDAAQGLGATYRGIPLGRFGELAATSFHETKNVISGEGGALFINDPAYVERAEIIREKGTDRRRFSRGEVDKYTWIDVGSSFAPSELTAAFLWAQMEQAAHDPAGATVNLALVSRRVRGIRREAACCGARASHRTASTTVTCSTSC